MRNAKICLIFAFNFYLVYKRKMVYFLYRCITREQRLRIRVLEVTIRKIIQCLDEWTNRHRVIKRATL